jgi:hypothetical protein
MKNLIKLSAVVILLTMTMGSFAQSKFRFGPKAGINISNMLAKDNDVNMSKDIKMKIGFHIGGIVEYSFTEKFALEPGLLLSTKGYKIDFDGMKGTLNIDYLEIPINAIYKISLGGDAIKIFFAAGPYLGIALTGKSKSEVAGQKTEKKIMIGSGEYKDIKPIDFGLNIGAGVEIKSILFGFQYGLGLANVSPVTTNGAKMANRVIGISFGYLFGGK